MIDGARAEGARLLALKGIAIADELYGGFAGRPVADADVWVLDSGRFPDVVAIARAMGLEPFDRSDHVLALREPGTGVILELHARLTSAASCFDVATERAWAERVEVPGRGYERLGAVDALAHMALHGAFQHALALKHWHFEDFRRGLARWSVDVEALRARAESIKAARCLGAFAFAAGADGAPDPRFSVDDCPAMLRRRIPGWLAAGDVAPSLGRLLAARLACVAPSRRFELIRRLVFPRTLPGLPGEPLRSRGARLLRRAVTP